LSQTIFCFSGGKIMTIKERISSYLQHHPEGIDDDELAKILALKSGTQVSSHCRLLEKEGLVVRRKVDGKIHNFWAGKSVPVKPASTQKVDDRPKKSSIWYWEGNIQAKVVDHLAAQKYSIRSVADTASHQQGINIVAERDGSTLWVSVKGYPKGTEKTNPLVQASQWFRQIIFDMIVYREKDKNVSLAVALPDYRRYRDLAKKITWFKSAANFTYFWVNEDGKILVE
jgi:hypothetical protein